MYNKIVVNKEVKLDISNDTVTENDVVAGKTFHKNDGSSAIGTYNLPNGNKSITSTEQINVTSYATAKVEDINLVPENIKENVSILGIPGTLKAVRPGQVKTVVPSTNYQVVTADVGYQLDKVNVEAVTESIDENIKPENIKEGVDILGVSGTYVGGTDFSLGCVMGMTIPEPMFSNATASLSTNTGTSYKCRYGTLTLVSSLKSDASDNVFYDISGSKAVKVTSGEYLFVRFYESTFAYMGYEDPNDGWRPAVYIDVYVNVVDTNLTLSKLKIKRDKDEDPIELPPNTKIGFFTTSDSVAHVIYSSNHLLTAATWTIKYTGTVGNITFSENYPIWRYADLKWITKAHVCTGVNFSVYDTWYPYRLQRYGLKEIFFSSSGEYTLTSVTDAGITATY